MNKRQEALLTRMWASYDRADVAYQMTNSSMGWSGKSWNRVRRISCLITEYSKDPLDEGQMNLAAMECESLADEAEEIATTPRKWA